MWVMVSTSQEMLGYASLPTTVVITAPRMSGIISTGSHVRCLKLPRPAADLLMTCHAALGLCCTAITSQQSHTFVQLPILKAVLGWADDEAAQPIRRLALSKCATGCCASGEQAFIDQWGLHASLRALEEARGSHFEPVLLATG